MSTLKDPRLSTLEPPDRLWYAEGVMLDAEDFWTEQTYHRGRLARALAYLHGGGTAAGLMVRIPSEAPTPELRVTPGLAVDRLGRLIESGVDRCLDLNAWWNRQHAAPDTRAALAGAWVGPAFATALAAAHVTVDVFVRFVPCQRGKTPAYATGPYDALNAVQPSRVRDEVEFSLELRPDAYDEQRKPRGLPDRPRPHVANHSNFNDWVGGLHEDILLRGWKHDWVGSQPELQPEHRLGQDSSALFLARIQVPVSDPSAATAPTPDWASARIDNHARRFVYPTSAIAQFLSQRPTP